jgi:hypothetical protein
MVKIFFIADHARRKLNPDKVAIIDNLAQSGAALSPLSRRPKLQKHTSGASV